MENPQPKISPDRGLSIQPQYPLAKHPKLSGEGAIAPQSRGDMTRLSASENWLPSEPSEPDTSAITIAPQPKAKRKSQASAAKRKQPASVRRMWEVSREQSEQYADDLQRLRLQAERINQLLADRARKKALLMQARESKQLPFQASIQQIFQPEQIPGIQAQQAAPLMPSVEDAIDQSLRVQAEQINRMLADLEAAIVKQGIGLPAIDPFHKIAENIIAGNSQEGHSVNQVQSAMQGFPSHQAGMPELPHQAQNPYQDAALQKAQQEAAEIAAALRHLTGREAQPVHSAPPVNQPPTTGVVSQFAPAVAQVSAPETRPMEVHPPETRSSDIRPRPRKLRLKQWLSLPQTPLDRLGDAALWVVIAAVVRVGIKFLLLAFPALAPVTTLLMLAPAAIAAYLAIFVPKAGWISIYRLFLITLGLVLGGKF
jgi:hypothetical protein